MTVTDLQKYLNLLGCAPPLTMDGILGPLTKAALSSFQTMLPYADPNEADGTPGPITAAAIDVLVAFGMKPLGPK